MQRSVSEKEIIEILMYIFDIQEELNANSDLSLYIKDSIDLGEFLAVLKNKHNIEPSHMELFRKYTLFGDVVKVVNNELFD